MDNNKTFLKIASIAASLTAVTTFLLWGLPNLYTSPSNFEEGVLLSENTYYLAKQWVNFTHIPLALTGYFGLAVILFQRQPVISIFGMVWFVIWGTIEMIGVSIILFSVNYQWRSGYKMADEINRIVLKNKIETFFSIWDSMFFVLLVAFLLGTLFFAWATWKSKGLEKILSCLLWLAVPLTLLIILSSYVGQGWAGQLTQYFYPFLQPLSRLILGLFIWKSIGQTKLPPTSYWQ